MPNKHLRQPQKANDPVVGRHIPPLRAPPARSAQSASANTMPSFCQKGKSGSVNHINDHFDDILEEEFDDDDMSALEAIEKSHSRQIQQGTVQRRNAKSKKRMQDKFSEIEEESKMYGSSFETPILDGKTANTKPVTTAKIVQTKAVPCIIDLISSEDEDNLPNRVSGHFEEDEEEAKKVQRGQMRGSQAYQAKPKAKAKRAETSKMAIEID